MLPLHYPVRPAGILVHRNRVGKVADSHEETGALLEKAGFVAVINTGRHAISYVPALQLRRALLCPDFQGFA